MTDPRSLALPCCEACGQQTLCCLVLFGNSERWYLCPALCLPALLAEARSWLRREQRHNELLREAGEDEDDEGPRPSGAERK